MRGAGLVVAALAVACGAGGGRIEAGSDSAAARGAGQTSAASGSRVEVYPVKHGAHGMRATLRWVHSPDRRAFIVLEDAVGVEAEAEPDGFLYASEASGAIVQADDAWDVAPSPDWTRLAFGRAFVLRAGETDTVPPEEWRRVEAMLPRDVAVGNPGLRRHLEAHAFAASGMSRNLGLGLTQVMWVDRLPAGRVARPSGPTHSLHGWRLRWTRGGDTLAVGAAPRMVQDDAPPARWVLVRPQRRATYADTLGSIVDASQLARVEWVAG